MTKSACVLAVLAAAVSTSAVAKDLKQDKKATNVPVVTATQMNDADMDKVTAGGFAFGGQEHPAWPINNGKADLAQGHNK
jgi:opacity protein-like surface antigen